MRKQLIEDDGDGFYVEDDGDGDDDEDGHPISGEEGADS